MPRGRRRSQRHVTNHGTYLSLDLLRLGKVHVVDCVDNILRRDLAAVEPAAVEAKDGRFASLDAVELDVDLAVIVIEGEVDVDDFAVLAVALALDIVLQGLLPVWLVHPVSQYVSTPNETWRLGSRRLTRSGRRRS